MRWKIFDGALNAGLLIDFMDRLVRNADRKIHLILGNPRGHHARPVKAWLAAHGESIEVHCMPSYIMFPCNTPLDSRSTKPDQ
jgi:hypothetical protein